MADRVREIFAAALRDFRFGWRQLVLTDVAYKVAAFALLLPLSGLALRGFLALSGNPAIADMDILFFALSPLGLITIIVVGTIILAVLVLELACLMIIGFDAEQKSRIGALEAFQLVARMAVPIVFLGMRVLGRVLLMAVPFLAAGGGVFLWLLTDYDINYYLAETPPVFWAAVVLIGAILLAMAGVLLPRLLGWIYAIPLLVLEGAPESEVLRRSTDKARGHRSTIAVVMGIWGGASLLAGTLAFGAVRLLAVELVPLVRGRPGALVFVIGGLVLLWSAANLFISVANMVSFALLGVALYDATAADDTGHAWSRKTPAATPAAGWVPSARTVAWGLGAGAAVAALLGWFLIGTVRVDDDVAIIAHRGAAGAAPENTMAAFERAIQDDADWVELDVQETADGRVVVIHDSDLMKIGGVNLAIWDATYEQLRDIDVGSWFAPEFADQRVPLLADVLALCKGRVGVFIELKYYGHDERLEERVVEIVEAAGMESDIVMMSLKYAGIQKVRELRPEWRVGLLTATAVGDLTRLDADFLAVNAGLATGSFVRGTHRRGKHAYVWTINDRVEMARFIGRGVDGIITDEPAMLREVATTMTGLEPVERLLVELALRMGIVPAGPEAATDDLEGETDTGPAGVPDGA